MAIVDAEQMAKVLWGALEDLVKGQIFLNPLEPTEEERRLMVATLVILATHIHAVVLRSTSGAEREAIYKAWSGVLDIANKARQVVDGQA